MVPPGFNSSYKSGDITILQLDASQLFHSQRSRTYSQSMRYEQQAEDDDGTEHGRLRRRLLFILAALLVALSLAIVVWEMMLISSVGVRNGAGPASHVSIKIEGTEPVR